MSGAPAHEYRQTQSTNSVEKKVSVVSLRMAAV